LTAPPCRDADEFDLVIHERAARIARVGGRVGFDHLRLEGDAPTVKFRLPALVVDLSHFSGRIDPQRPAAAGVSDRMNGLSGGRAIGGERECLSTVGYAVELDDRQIGLLIAGHDAAANPARPFAAVVISFGDDLARRGKQEKIRSRRGRYRRRG